MTTKTFKRFIYLTSFIFSTFVYSQTPNCYYNKDWEPTSKENASFYRIITPQPDGLYKIEDYYLNGTLQMSGYSKTATCEDDGEYAVKECTWYDEQGKMTSYKKYNEKGGVTYSKTIEHDKEIITEYDVDSESTVKQTLTNTATQFRTEYAKSESGYSEKLYYKNTLLADKKTVTIDDEETFGKYYDFKGNLLYEKKEDNNDEIYYEYDYYNLGYIKSTFKGYESLKKETFDSQNKMIASINYKDDSPYEGTLYGLSNYDELRATEYKEGIQTSIVFFYDNGKPQQKVLLNSDQRSSQTLYFDRDGKQLGSLNFDKYETPMNGSFYIDDVLISVYQNGCLVEEYCYYDTKEENVISNSYGVYYTSYRNYNSNLKKENLRLIYSQKEGERKYFDKDGKYLSSLKLRKEKDRYSDRCDWEAIEGRYYKTDYDVDYESYADYKNGKIVFSRSKSYSSDYIEETTNRDNEVYTKIFDNKTLLEEKIEDQEGNIISQKIYKNNAIESQYTSNPKNGKLILYNRNNYSQPSFVSEYNNGKLMAETQYNYEDNKKPTKFYEYKNNTITFYSNEGKTIAQANLQDNAPYNGTVILSDLIQSESALNFPSFEHDYTVKEKMYRYFSSNDYSYVAVDSAKSMRSNIDSTEVKYAYTATDTDDDDSYSENIFLSLKNGEINGELKTYNGTLKKVKYHANYLDGAINGNEIFYNKEGEIVEFNTYKNGFLEGECYVEDKKLKEKFVCTYKDNLPYNGRVYNNDDVTEYKNGVIIKFIEDYKSDTKTTTYTMLKEDSYKVEFFVSGEKYLETIVPNVEKRGVIDGEVIYFDNGKKIRSCIFKKGKLIKGTFERNEVNYDYDTHGYKYTKVVISCMTPNQYSFIFYNDDEIISTTEIKSDSETGTDFIELINNISIYDLTNVENDYYYD